MEPEVQGGAGRIIPEQDVEGEPSDVISHRDCSSGTDQSGCEGEERYKKKKALLHS